MFKWKDYMLVKELKEYLDKLVEENKANSKIYLRTNSEEVDKYFDSIELNFEDDCLILDFDINAFEDVIK